MEEAANLFEQAIVWLRENYTRFQFFQERDLVWTVQTHIVKLIQQQGLAYQIFNDYRMTPGSPCSPCADLAICGHRGSVEVAAEFKYEPSHQRTDILPGKFDVVGWGDVKKDVDRIQEFVAQGKARVGYSLLIDEGGHFRHRNPLPQCRWIDWEPSGASSSHVSVLWSRVAANS